MAISRGHLIAEVESIFSMEVVRTKVSFQKAESIITPKPVICTHVVSSHVIAGGVGGGKAPKKGAQEPHMLQPFLEVASATGNSSFIPAG